MKFNINSEIEPRAFTWLLVLFILFGTSLLAILFETLLRLPSYVSTVLLIITLCYVFFTLFYVFLFAIVRKKPNAEKEKDSA